MTHQQIQDLILSDAKPPKRADRFFPQDDLRKDFVVPRIAKKVQPVGDSFPDILKAMETCTSSDEIRPAMCYVFSDGQHLVATDAHKMVFTPTNAKPGYFYHSDQVKAAESERVFNKDIPEIKLGDYVNVDAKQILWKTVIPEKKGGKIVRLSDLYSVCLGAKRFNSFIVTPTKMTVKVLDAYLAWDILSDAILAMLKLGEDKVKVQCDGHNKAVCFWGKRTSGLVMPVLNDNNQMFYTEFEV